MNEKYKDYLTEEEREIYEGGDMARLLINLIARNRRMLVELKDELKQLKSEIEGGGK